MKLFYVVACEVILLIIAYLTTPIFFTKDTEFENCRLWGIIFNELDSSLENTVHTHLESFQSLGNTHQDGWGIGYYLSPDSGVILPVISRGEPRAPLDPRYDKVVDNMISYVKKCGIAHIRSGSSGPTSGIPDPHPFLRSGVYRDFQMLFAHHGKIPEDVLLSLIQGMNPTYLDSNPPDYTPNYLDSDLYSIYMIGVIDKYFDFPIEECIKIAITKLDSALGNSSAECNFVMSDGSTLWALRFIKSITTTKGYNLYYYPNESISDFWVAATEPVDTLQSYWVAVPNSILVALTPGEPPQIVNVFEENEFPYTDVRPGFRNIYPNPFEENTKINYVLLDNVEVSMKIYDASGGLVRQFDHTTIGQSDHIIWDGSDDQGDKLPNGIYFCSLIIGDNSYVKKIVLVK
jgi:predicted glutamine amidotransferase